MIICECIHKKYRNQNVLDDFSYRFEDTGFYLLYGASGSGKTTLLNILAGHIPFDKGCVRYDGRQYDDKVQLQDISSRVEYITQDAHFVDYLSVRDNLSLCTNNEELIDEYAMKFGLSDKLNMLPKKLSGGEKQRLCIIRSLIQQKSIILLDEPTASLDSENKIMVFELLKKLSESVLIICSSHDKVAKEYADACVEFNKKDMYKKELLEKVDSFEEVHRDKLQVNAKKHRRLGSYINKWFKSPLKEKKSKLSFLVVMLFAFLAIYLGDTPENKLYSSIEYIYGVNQLRLNVTSEHMEYVASLYNREEIDEIVLCYNSVPNGYALALNEDGTVPEGVDPDFPYIREKEVDYLLDAWTLPVDNENFNMDEYLAYGRYIEDEYEIILSDAMALKMGKPEALIGQTMDVKLYDGTYKFTIVGIFEEFTEVQKQYAYNSGILVDEDKSMYEDSFAISAAITNNYIEDESCFCINKRNYILYFDSYADMMRFYEKESANIEEIEGIQYVLPSVAYGIKDVFVSMHTFMLPVSVIVMLMAVVFYYQTQKTELTYNQNIFAAYQYYGYKVQKVKRYWILFSTWEMAKISLKALSGSLLIAIIANWINRRIKFIPFEIFTFNVRNISVLIMSVMLVGIINIVYMLRKIKSENINKNLIEQRDLL